MIRLLGVALLIATTFPTTSTAQAAPARGDLIRLQLRVPDAVNFTPAPRIEGRFLGVTGEHVDVQTSRGRVISVAIDSIQRAAHGRQRSRSAGMRRGMLWGAIGGFVAGFAIGVTSPEPDAGPLISEAVDTGVLAGAVLGVLASTCGAIIGATSPGVEWRNVPPDDLRAVAR